MSEERIAGGTAQPVNHKAQQNMVQQSVANSKAQQNTAQQSAATNGKTQQSTAQQPEKNNAAQQSTSDSAKNQDTILDIDHVSIAYDRAQEYAVEDVSFSVHRGEYICLIGSNGSGKSTLMKSIVGLVPITKGSVNLKIAPDAFAYMGQINQIEKGFPATVWEVVLSGTQKREKRLPFYTKKDKEVAKRAMETFDILPMANRRIGNLSGGQQQRVLLARAFCRNPQLLILDEPCAGLDQKITEEFYNILDHLNKEKDVTILMASHDMAQVSSYASRVIVMNQKMEFDGDANEWLGRDNA